MFHLDFPQWKTKFQKNWNIPTEKVGFQPSRSHSPPKTRDRTPESWLPEPHGSYYLCRSNLAQPDGSPLPSNQSIAALADGGSSKDTVASPFSFPVSRSVYRLIMGCPVFLFVWNTSKGHISWVQLLEISHGLKATHNLPCWVGWKTKEIIDSFRLGNIWEICMGRLWEEHQQDTIRIADAHNRDCHPDCSHTLQYKCKAPVKSVQCLPSTFQLDYSSQLKLSLHHYRCYFPSLRGTELGIQCRSAEPPSHLPKPTKSLSLSQKHHRSPDSPIQS